VGDGQTIIASKRIRRAPQNRVKGTAAWHNRGSLTRLRWGTICCNAVPHHFHLSRIYGTYPDTVPVAKQLVPFARNHVPVTYTVKVAGVSVVVAVC
jgi:hypothetical protein